MRIHFFEDLYIKNQGLYALWTALFITNLAVLGHDDTSGSVRDFNIITSLFTTLYCSISAYNIIYGNGLPSTMLMIAGPIHQYSFWLLLAYYRGQVYGITPIGIFNSFMTAIVGLFSIDMVTKTWYICFKQDKYLDYVEKEIAKRLED